VHPLGVRDPKKSSKLFKELKKTDLKSNVVKFDIAGTAFLL